MFTNSEFFLPCLDEMPSVEFAMNNLDIQDSEVYNELISLDGHWCYRSQNFEELCYGSLFSTLSSVFSLSFSQHVVPEEWRIHLITPIYKPRDNYNY